MKTPASQQRGITIVLHIDRFVFGDQFHRRAIPVIVMGMGNDHRIGVQQRADVNGQFNHWVTDLGPRRAETGVSVFAASIGSIKSVYRHT